MINTVFAPPRTGKTVYVTYKLNEAEFDLQRRSLQRAEILKMQNAGFKVSIPPSISCSSYPVLLKKFGYTPKKAIIFNPFRLGFFNESVQTRFFAPYSVFGITEAQKYLNSRMSIKYPEWQSRFFEMHGHNHYDFYLDTQRPMLIDVNIRELSSFTEIVKLDVISDKYGYIKRLKWTVRFIENSQAFDLYMASGKRDKSLYVEKTEIADYNVFELYDSFSAKPKFYEGHLDEDYYNFQAIEPELSVNGYESYLKMFNDNIPKGFYKGKND